MIRVYQTGWPLSLPIVTIQRPVRRRQMIALVLLLGFYTSQGHA
jgi:hypothetical protein